MGAEKCAKLLTIRRFAAFPCEAIGEALRR
jgi:hypothetical protein